LKYRLLGRTGLRVSILGFGGIPIRRVSEPDARAVVNRALDLGVNLIHTSVICSYGPRARNCPRGRNHPGGVEVVSRLSVLKREKWGNGTNVPRLFRVGS